MHDDNVHAIDFNKLTIRFDGPRFSGKTPVKYIADILPASNLSAHLTKIYYDRTKAPNENILDVDRLDDQAYLDLLARFIYQVHQFLSGGLNYSSYQEKWVVK